MHLRPILEVAEEAGLSADELHPYGPWKAKVDLSAVARRQDDPDARVVLVTAITPTSAGEGKTVTAIALAQALRSLGARTMVCLREPSMGPVFGLKGGATGGGKSTVEPADDINLHFTGDFHAVGAANNLLAAMLDEHIYRGRPPLVDVRRPVFPRVLDVNDRALRSVVVGLAGAVPREDHFAITAASEVMAILALARGYDDLRQRLGRLIAGVTPDGQPITADALRAAGAMAALLRDALQPNLVQTQEGCPAFIHAGPFANIAHGTSSLVSLALARKLAEYVVVEAGFGADLGAEKFIHIVGNHGGPHPDAAVVVATTRALKCHVGVATTAFADPNPAAVAEGLPQIRHHVELIRRLGVRPVVCVNVFSTDAPEELRIIADAAQSWGVPVARSSGFIDGGAGAVELAEVVRGVCRQPQEETRRGLYAADSPLTDKIQAVVRGVYGGVGATFSPVAQRRLAEAEAWVGRQVPVCMAKTQYSLTDQPQFRGVPTGFTIHIRDAAVRAGAGFVLALAGDMMTMPALPSHPHAWNVELDSAGVISGIS